MNQLVELSMGLNALTDKCLLFIGQLKNLYYLDLSQNRLEDISELKTLTLLKVLDLN